MGPVMSGAPDVILEGGYLPVSADLIESQLNEIWSQGSQDDDSKRLVKICLANVLIVTDAAARLSAENLAQQIATRHPSRVFLIIVDETLSTYCAFVRTACDFNAELDALVCWEIIEILSDEPRSSFIGGAVRSLLVDSVPVLTIDFRAYQFTPECDADLRAMSDYYLVQAEVVSVAAESDRLVPLSWYRTLDLREMIGAAYSAVLASSSDSTLARIVIYFDNAHARLDPFLAGWLVHRLADGGKFEQFGGEVRFTRREQQVSLTWAPAAAPDKVLEIEFADQSKLTIMANRSRHGGYCDSRALVDGRLVASQTGVTGLAEYVLAATNGGGNDFREYAAVQRVMTMLRIP